MLAQTMGAFSGLMLNYNAFHLNQYLLYPALLWIFIFILVQIKNMLAPFDCLKKGSCRFFLSWSLVNYFDSMYFYIYNYLWSFKVCGRVRSLLCCMKYSPFSDLCLCRKFWENYQKTQQNRQYKWFYLMTLSLIKIPNLWRIRHPYNVNCAFISFSITSLLKIYLLQ